MKRYEVYLTEDRIAIVEAEWNYCSGAVVMFFVKINEKQETVAVFNLENILGYKKIEETG